MEKRSNLELAIDGAICEERRRREASLAIAELAPASADLTHGPSPENLERGISALLGLDLATHQQAARQRQREVVHALEEGRRRIEPRPRAEPWWKHLEPASDAEPPTFPICFTSAMRCEVPESPDLSCELSPARLRLRNDSQGLGGHFGILAIPTIPPVTGELWYGFEPPESGIASVMAQVSLRGGIYAYAVTGSSILDLLPTVYGEAKLVLRLSVHQADIVHRSPDLVFGPIRNKGQPQGIYFDDDIYVMALQAGVRGQEPVSIQVGAELHAFGRSTWGSGHAGFNHGRRNEDGISVPVLCVGFSRHVIL